MTSSASILLSILRQDDSIRLEQVTAQEWQQVIDLAFSQSVDAISVDGYHKCLDSGTMECLLETDESLEDLKFEWFGSVLQAEEDYRCFTETISSLAKIFAENGLKMMVLKGFGLSQDYPIPAHRSLGDIDIFLTDGDTPLSGPNPAALKGDEIFRSRGYTVSTDNPHHSQIDYNGITIENHHFILVLCNT